MRIGTIILVLTFFTTTKADSRCHNPAHGHVYRDKATKRIHACSNVCKIHHPVRRAYRRQLAKPDPLVRRAYRIGPHQHNHQPHYNYRSVRGRSSYGRSYSRSYGRYGDNTYYGPYFYSEHYNHSAHKPHKYKYHRMN